MRIITPTPDEAHGHAPRPTVSSRTFGPFLDFTRSLFLEFENIGMSKI